MEEIYIPDSVVSITGKVRTESPFYGINGNVLKIYCETSSKPDGYETYWAAGQRIEYGYTIKNADDYFYFTLDETNKSMTITGIKGLYAKEKVSTIDDRYLVAGIEYQVTAIGDSAFEYVGMGESLESIRLPAGIAVIGQWAFASNINLQDIDLGRCVHLREIKASALKITDTTKQAVLVGDADEDGVLTLNDANLILKAALKIISIHKVVILDPPTQSKPDSKEDVWKVDAPIGWEPYAESYVDPEFYIKHNDPYDDILNGSGYPPLQHKKK